MRLKQLVSAIALSTVAAASQAEIVDIEITNLTHGIHYTPFFLAAHTDAGDFFEIGETASSALEVMAEAGGLDGLVAQADAMGAETFVNPVGTISAMDPGFLRPGQSASITDWDTGSNDKLTVLAMLLPTNDGFAGLDGWSIPSESGTYTVYLNGYDAGTEANDELMNPGMPGATGAGIPGNPGGDNGTGGTGVTDSESNKTVHIHRGVLGDTVADGGVSDLDSRIHRWLNPVAKLVVTVK